MKISLFHVIRKSTSYEYVFYWSDGACYDSCSVLFWWWSVIISTPDPYSTPPSDCILIFEVRFWSVLLLFVSSLTILTSTSYFPFSLSRLHRRMLPLFPSRSFLRSYVLLLFCSYPLLRLHCPTLLILILVITYYLLSRIHRPILYHLLLFLAIKWTFF